MENDVCAMQFPGIVKQGTVDAALETIQRGHGGKRQGYAENEDQGMVPAMDKLSEKKFGIHGSPLSVGYLAVKKADFLLSLGGNGLAMRGHNQGGVVLTLHIEQQTDNFLTIFGVEVPRRLISKYYPGSIDQGTTEGDSLFLTTGKL